MICGALLELRVASKSEVKQSRSHTGHRAFLQADLMLLCLSVSGKARLVCARVLLENMYTNVAAVKV